VVMLVAVTFILLGMMPGGLGFLRTWGDLVSVFFLYFLSQSLLKYRLLDLQELLGRGLVLIAVALILSIVFGVLVLWAGVSPEVSLFHTFIASFVILILFEPLRDKVEGSTNRLLFRERYEFRGKLEDLRREIANILDLKQMTHVILDTLYESMRITRSSIYFQDDGGASYYLVGHRGPNPPARIDVAAHRAFFDQVKKTPTVVLAETYERFVAEQGTPADSSKASSEVQHARQVLKTLAHMKSALCIPFPSQDEILGLWNLQDEASAESYSTEEIARLIALGEQAAINIENSKAFEHIRERDRLAVLGEMSAGLAHEIRNPLGAIKGAAQYLDPSSVGEDTSQFLKIIIEEVDRLNQVVDQFLDYSRPFQAQKDPTDINRIILQTTRLLSTSLAERSIELKLELQSDLPLVDANAPQLTQVFFNLLNNALEAMPEGGQLIVRSKLRSGGFGSWSGLRRLTGAVEVQVVDTGRGIPLPEQERLFVPFFTTKEHGTGLGLSISQRIVEHHGGEIRVRSKEGEGSTFSVVLPYPTDTTAPAEGLEEKGKKAASSNDLPFPDEDSREKS
jgi:two-component system sensor histidine kinase HydH